ncbi:MAG TPA: extracellular solute-binding protein [Conexibacter sp.]|nr:extracellular solute-binding protein [Conexibacter sp.]
MRNCVAKGFALVLACVLLAGLAACGSNDGGSGGSSGGGGSTTAEKRLSGTITVWDLNYRSFPDYTRAVDKLDAAFEALHPGVTIRHVGVPLAQEAQTLQAAFTARRGPDVINLHPGPTGVLHWSKGLERLNDRVTDDMRENLVGWEMLSTDLEGGGDLYAVPSGLFGFVFYYNKQLFRRAGLPTDFKPQTWEELKEAAEKLKAAGIQPFAGGNKEGYENGWWLDAGWQTVNTPEQASQLGRGEIPFTDPIVEKAYEPQRMMQEAGLFAEDSFTTPLFPDGVQRFADGKGAMILGGFAIAASYAQFNPTLGERNVGLFFSPGSRYLTAFPSSPWGIPSFSTNKDAAWAYIEYTISKEGQELLYKEGKVLPAHKGVEIAADAPVQERMLLEAARSQPTGPSAHQMISGSAQEALRNDINEAHQGRKSFEDALQAVQDANEKSK